MLRALAYAARSRQNSRRENAGSAPIHASAPVIPLGFEGDRTVSKLILISVLLATIGLPTIAARDENPRRGLRRTLTYMAAFYAFYLFGLMFLYGRF